MIKLPNLLLIGAAERNVGKTTLACQLISKYNDTSIVIGLKITVIKERGNICPRGGKGCGVCSSLSGNYSISMENNYEGPKDTSKMLKAGAKAVYWLRVLDSSLDEGVERLFSRIYKDQKQKDLCIICESNSARHAIDPGLFFVIKRKGSIKIKESCRKVEDKADKIVIFDNDGHNISPETQVNFINGDWSFRETATAVIMAGGQNKRMGREKALLEKDNSTFIESLIKNLNNNFSEVIISSNNKETYEKFGCRVVNDLIPGQGPLMGIYSSLKSSESDVNFIIACDIPEINFSFIRRLIIESESADIVIPVIREGRFEPLFAVYKKSALSVMENALNSGHRKISVIFDKLNTKFIKVENFDWYCNINTPEDYKKYLSDRIKIKEE